MATPWKIHITTDLKPSFAQPPLTEESAKAASEVLQENHELHHTLFNERGFHNHIVHHILTLYAMGATPTQIKLHYKNNVSYQRPQMLPGSEVTDLSDPQAFKEALGKHKSYKNFLNYFQKEIDAKGWQRTILEYLLDDSDRAKDLHSRLLAGLFHPYIHLGFGIEFQQPALIAEALAQTAVHRNYLLPLMTAASAKAKTDNHEQARSIYDILDEVRSDKELIMAPRWEDGDKIGEGIMARAPDRMVYHAAKYTVRPGDLRERVKELVDLDLFMTVSAQRPPKEPKMCFFNLHCANSSIFYDAILLSPLTSGYLSEEQKCTLLEWKGRMDIAMYVARGCPQLESEAVMHYIPKKVRSRWPFARQKASGSQVFEELDRTVAWFQIIKRTNAYEDDGHAIKLIRALLGGSKLCGCDQFDATLLGTDGASTSNGTGFKRNMTYDMWLQAGHMAIDSVEASRDGSSRTEYVRNSGFQKAWEDIPFRTDAWDATAYKEWKI